MLGAVLGRRGTCWQSGTGNRVHKAEQGTESDMLVSSLGLNKVGTGAAALEAAEGLTEPLSLALPQRQGCMGVPVLHSGLTRGRGTKQDPGLGHGPGLHAQHRKNQSKPQQDLPYPPRPSALSGPPLVRCFRQGSSDSVTSPAGQRPPWKTSSKEEDNLEGSATRSRDRAR